jgi:molybdate transport system substrate-binding protein
VLLNASSIGFTRQGASRAATEALFVNLGIADHLKPKIKLVQSTAAEGVLNGEVEVGIGPISEIFACPGVEFVGPLPAEIQWYLILPAGIATASANRDSAVAFIKFLTSPAALPVLRAKGMEPG